MNLFKNIKKLLLFIVKEIFSFFIKLILIIIILFGIGTVFISKRESEKNNINLNKENIYINIDLAQTFNEKAAPKNPLDDDSLDFYSLLDVIWSSNEDKNVKGIIFNLDDISLNYAQIEELAKELEIYKAENKKEIIAYMQDVDKKNYYLATYADKIYMPPTNSTVVNIFPYFRETFYKKTLFDKLGVKFNIVNTGDYKSYGEDLANSKMSKENREDTTRILEKNYSKFIDVVSKNRKIDKKKLMEIIENGDLVAASSKDLYEKKLIDGYFYWNEIEKKIGEDNLVSLEQYANYSKKTEKFSSESKNIIHILALEGEIVDSEADVFEQMFISSEYVVNELEKLAKNDKVKGIVLRINSPGGSALTSDIINNKIKEVKKKKPIYVSMAGVAASGGYYISANSNKIFANENTITGSIGVVSILPNFSQLLDKIGVNNEKIAKGKFSDIYSSDELTEEKYNKILNSNLKVYDDFLREVSEGRKIKIEEVKKIAEGRVWTGKEALNIGLVDEIGGLFDTIDALAEELELEDYEIDFSEEEFDIKSIYKKYSKLLKVDKIAYVKDRIYKNYLYRKPVVYFPYEILE